jgi:hypothetical protein
VKGVCVEEILFDYPHNYKCDNLDGLGSSGGAASNLLCLSRCSAWLLMDEFQGLAHAVFSAYTATATGDQISCKIGEQLKKFW